MLEARDRVGGRAWSQELIPDDQRTVVERGAEFVLDGYDVMREVLTGLRLELAVTTMSYYDRKPRSSGPAGTTAGDLAGLMEGALRSGVRAAHEVLALSR